MSGTTTIRNLLDGHLAAEIVCAMRATVVRRFVVHPDMDIVDVDFGDNTQVGLSLDTVLSYDAWIMDRGSIVFIIPEHMRLPDMPICGKLCTEFDILRFDDGTEITVEAP